MRTSALRKAVEETSAASAPPEPNFQPPAPVRRVAPSGPVLSTFGSHDMRYGRSGRQRIAAFLLATLFEVVLVGGVWFLLGQPEKPRDRDDAEEIAMVQAPPPQTPPQPVDQPPPKKIELPKITPRIVIPRLRPPPPLVVPPVPSPPDAMTPPSPPPPPPPAQSANAEVVDRFQAELRAAVESAMVYPPAARMMRQQGRAKVAFTLEHGHAEAARIVESSGNASLDAAALAAVRDAHYPSPPPELAGRELSFAIFVQFSLSSH